MPTRHRTTVVFLLSTFWFFQLRLPAQTAGKTNPPPAATFSCDADPAYHKLDFWVGRWDVFNNSDGSKDGTNVIEKILQGCAIIENWQDVAGGEGKSLFYYQRATQQWKQVWVTDAGPMKEKKLVQEFKNGAIRFQGEIPHLNGGSHLDRTTLTPLPGDRVRQVIETSTDGGKTWSIGFDAEYRRQKQ
jgi:hypothetical protein